jgi:hypothetical protein
MAAPWHGQAPIEGARIIKRRKNIRANGGRMPGKLLTMTGKPLNANLALAGSPAELFLLMRE